MRRVLLLIAVCCVSGPSSFLVVLLLMLILMLAHCPAFICYEQAKFGYQRIVAVGDGATDMEARQPDAANIFIG